jgi:hypothetical protein
VRATTVFDGLLALPGITVRSMSVPATDTVEVTVALRRKKLVCPLCDYTNWARHDTRPVASTWRHLDAGRWRDRRDRRFVDGLGADLREALPVEALDQRAALQCHRGDLDVYGLFLGRTSILATSQY